MNKEQTERQILELIATDRIDVPISSMSGKLKRQKPKLAQAVNLSPSNTFRGERVYATLSEEDKQKARGMREGIDVLSQRYPKQGEVLQGIIDEQRAYHEVHLTFGMYEGTRLTSDDYLGVMESLGFTDTMSRNLYPELMKISRNLSRKRDEADRSILVG